MAYRSIGQERLGFTVSSGSASSLDDLSCLIDWDRVAGILGQVHSSAKGEPAWPPLAMFKALLLSVWYDLSDVKLAEALDDRASFRTFCGFSRTEATPERTAFIRFRKALIAHQLDRLLYTTVTAQLKAKAITVKTGTLVDATILGLLAKAMVMRAGSNTRVSLLCTASRHMSAPMPTQRWSKKLQSHPPTSTTAEQAPMHCPVIPARYLQTAPIAEAISVRLFLQRAEYRALSPRACGAATNRQHCESSRNGTSQSTVCGAASKRYLGHGNEAMACDEYDGVASPKPPSKSTSQQSPTISNEH